MSQPDRPPHCNRRLRTSSITVSNPAKKPSRRHSPALGQHRRTSGEPRSGRAARRATPHRGSLDCTSSRIRPRPMCQRSAEARDVIVCACVGRINDRRRDHLGQLLYEAIGALFDPRLRHRSSRHRSSCARHPMEARRGYWLIASFRCVAELGRYGGMADIE